MNHDDPTQRRRSGAFAGLSAAVGAALAAAMIPVAPAFADPADDAVGAAAFIATHGCCEAIADKDLFEYFSVHDGSAAGYSAVETLNTDLSGLSNPGATALEELVIAIFGNGEIVPPDMAAAVLP